MHLQVFEHEDISYGDVIGKGGEGVVRKCNINYHGIVNLEAAVKTLSDNSPDAISLTLEEIELLWYVLPIYCFAHRIDITVHL